ncbi:MAG: LysR substrate-binding domain-containing protein [Pseudomonadota bacterium]
MAGRRIPSLNWLRVFETAARAESFARAAEVLGMSPPAVSQQIRALEGYLGRPLFERGPREVRLTEAGRAFLPVVTNALVSVEMTAGSLFGRADAAPLTVRVSTMLACSWLAERLGAFTRQHPNVQLTLVTGTMDQDFSRPGAEMKITFGAPPEPGETSDPLFGESLSAVALPALAETVQTPADLLSHPLIEVSSHRATWYRLLPEAGDLPLAPRFLFTDTTAVALAMAAAGAGIALARAPATDALVARYGLVPCLPGVAAPGIESYHLVYPAGARLSAAARAFRDWLLAEAAQA